MNQILAGHTTVAVGAIERNRFDELSHVSAPALLLRYEVNFSCVIPAVNDDNVCDIGLVNKPRSDNNGIAVAGDLLNEQYSIMPQRCMTGTLSTTGATDIDHIHEKHNMKITVPLVNELEFVVDNLSSSAVTMAIAYLVRLFWKLL